MSSGSVVLSGKPRVRRAPRSASNEADDAVFLSSRYGLKPDDWQEDILESWLGRRRDGRWSAATCGLAVPRQNGKNAVIEVRELFGMVFLGERFLHTAHEVKTARKAFLRIASFFENDREFPELAALVRDIRKTNGQEAVILTNGGSVEFIARSKSSGRGFTVDVLVCDEAQELTAEELEALGPTISAAPSGNPQMIFTGTPPEPERAQGEVFRGLREVGEAGADARLAWTDYGVADGPLPDVDDRSLWDRHNPGLRTGRMHVAEIERERMLFSPEGFAKERLGWWPPTALAGTLAVDPAKWRACADPASLIVGRPFLAVAMPPDRTSVTLAAAGKRPDGQMHVEIVLHGQPGRWFIDKTVEIARLQGSEVAIVPTHPAGSLLSALEEANLRIRTLTGSEYTQACGSFHDAVVAETVHYLPPQPELDDSVARATRKQAGESWRWAGDGISALVAATQAFHAASTFIPVGSGRAIGLR